MCIGLPNAQYITFIGIPLLVTKLLTNQWFGEYVYMSEYNYAQSIADGSTVPLYNSRRISKVWLANNFRWWPHCITENENLTLEKEERLSNYSSKKM